MSIITAQQQHLMNDLVRTYRPADAWNGLGLIYCYNEATGASDSAQSGSQSWIRVAQNETRADGDLTVLKHALENPDAPLLQDLHHRGIRFLEITDIGAGGGQGAEKPIQLMQHLLCNEAISPSHYRALDQLPRFATGSRDRVRDLFSIQCEAATADFMRDNSTQFMLATGEASDEYDSTASMITIFGNTLANGVSNHRVTGMQSSAGYLSNILSQDNAPTTYVLMPYQCDNDWGRLKREYEAGPKTAIDDFIPSHLRHACDIGAITKVIDNENNKVVQPEKYNLKKYWHTYSEYNPETKAVEIHMVSLRDHTLMLGDGRTIEMPKGHDAVPALSYKWGINEWTEIFRQAGADVISHCEHPEGQRGILLAKKREPRLN